MRAHGWVLLVAGVVGQSSSVESVSPQVSTASTNELAAFGDYESLEVIHPRPGVSLPFAVKRPSAQPIGTVILFSGGDGRLRLTKEGYGAATHNFLVRSRSLFADGGWVVVLPDVPSDKPTGLGAFRLAAAHAEDVRALVSWIKAKWSGPVFLIGTSRGTISAANAILRGKPPNVAGLALASSVTAGSGDTVLDLPLERIAVPTLLIHHQDDACRASPYRGAVALFKRLRSSKKMQAFVGGQPPQAGPCTSLSQHGFLGIERDVVQSIMAWMKGARPD
jgi:pimeloyl-ACP methyl ester carboxylesterase